MGLRSRPEATNERIGGGSQKWGESAFSGDAWYVQSLSTCDELMDLTKDDLRFQVRLLKLYKRHLKTRKRENEKMSNEPAMRRPLDGHNRLKVGADLVRRDDDGYCCLAVHVKVCSPPSPSATALHRRELKPRKNSLGPIIPSC